MVAPVAAAGLPSTPRAMDDDALFDLASDLATLVGGLRTTEGRPVLRDLARSADPAGTGQLRVDLLRGEVTPGGPWSAGAEQPLRAARVVVDQLTLLRGGEPRALRSATMVVHAAPAGDGGQGTDEARYRGRLEITDQGGRTAWAEVRG